MIPSRNHCGRCGPTQRWTGSRRPILAGNYPTVRYGPPDEDFLVDILSRLGIAFPFDDIEAERLVIDGIAVQVATPAMFFRMKRGLMPVELPALLSSPRRQCSPA